MNDPTSVAVDISSLARLVLAPDFSTVLPARAYTDPRVFEVEKERIFYRTWQYIGPESELATPGDYLTGEIVDERVFVIRTGEGELKAFFNVCKHRAHGLLHGRGRVRRHVTCPNHGWSYDLDGRLRNAPGCERVSGFDPSAITLSPVRVETLKGLVFVNLDPQAPSLADSYPGLAEQVEALVPELDQLGAFPSEDEDSQSGGNLGLPGELRANWKVLLDNCVECYHCRIAHPAFADLVDLETYRIEDHGTFTKHVADRVRPDNRAYRFSKADPVQRLAVWHLWPNTTISVSPGIANLGVFKFTPARHDLTLIHSNSFRKPGPLSDAERDRIRFNADIFWPEDVRICESVWQGFHSRSFEGGPLLLNGALDATSEDTVRLFHRMWAKSMETPKEAVAV